MQRRKSPERSEVARSKTGQHPTWRTYSALLGEVSRAMQCNALPTQKGIAMQFPKGRALLVRGTGGCSREGAVSIAA